MTAMGLSRKEKNLPASLADVEVFSAREKNEKVLVIVLELLLALLVALAVEKVAISALPGVLFRSDFLVMGFGLVRVVFFGE